jgi:hypothetical protein
MLYANSRLLDVRRKLPRWLPYIKKFSYADDIRILPGASGEFTVLATWNTPKPGSYSRKFDLSYIVKPGGKGMSKKACRFADDIIMDILLERRK